MTITQILYVLETARCNSFSKAAEQLYISQPALSVQIKKLEQELGYALFIRDYHGVTLTDSGKIFCDMAKTISRTWHEFKEQVTKYTNHIKKVIRIGVGPRAFTNGLIDIVLTFFEHYPETDIAFINDYHDDAPKALDERRIDLALDRVPPDIFLYRKDALYIKSLLSEPQCILVPSDSPFASSHTLTLQDLSGYDVISSTEETLGDRILQNMFIACHTRPNRIYRSDSFETSMLLIEKGKGISIGSPSFTKGYNVVAVPLVPPSEISLCIMYLKQNQCSPLIKQLERHIISHLPKQN